MKVNRSKSLSILNVVPRRWGDYSWRWASAWRRDVWCLFPKMTTGKQPRFFLFSVPPSLRWNDRSRIVPANTKEPEGGDSSPQGVRGERSAFLDDCGDNKNELRLQSVCFYDLVSNWSSSWNILQPRNKLLSPPSWETCFTKLKDTFDTIDDLFLCLKGNWADLLKQCLISLGFHGILWQMKPLSKELIIVFSVFLHKSISCSFCSVNINMARMVGC